MSDDELGRCPSTGRFQKGFSGNSGRKGKKRQTALLPHQLAEAILEAAAFPVEVKDRNGRIQRLPALVVVLRQLTALGTQGDKNALRQFVAATTEAAKTVQAHKQRQFDRLGAYLRSVDEGTPWPLEEAEAAFYQDLADQAGLHITITAFDPNRRPPPVRGEDIEAVMNDPAVRTLLQSAADGPISPEIRRTIVRRALQAYENQRFKARLR